MEANEAQELSFSEIKSQKGSQGNVKSLDGIHSRLECNDFIENPKLSDL
jgi:hypothetical protein